MRTTSKPTALPHALHRKQTSPRGARDLRLLELWSSTTRVPHFSRAFCARSGDFSGVKIRLITVIFYRNPDLLRDFSNPSCLQFGKSGLENVIGGPFRWHFHKQPQVLVELNERRSAPLIGLEPHLDRFGPVIFPLKQSPIAPIAHPF